jgi:hypothetical protein
MAPHLSLLVNKTSCSVSKPWYSLKNNFLLYGSTVWSVFPCSRLHVSYHVYICFPQASIRMLHSSILSSRHRLLSSHMLLLCIIFSSCKCLTCSYASRICFYCIKDNLHHGCRVLMAAVLLILGMVKVAAPEITSFILGWSNDVRIRCILWQAVVKKQIWCSLAGQGYKQSNSKHDVDRLLHQLTSMVRQSQCIWIGNSIFLCRKQVLCKHMWLGGILRLKKINCVNICICS